MTESSANEPAPTNIIYDSRTGEGFIAVLTGASIMAYHARNDRKILNATISLATSERLFDAFTMMKPLVDPDTGTSMLYALQEGTRTVAAHQKTLCGGCCNVAEKDSDNHMVAVHVRYPGFTIGCFTHRSDTCRNEAMRCLGFFEILYRRSEDDDATDTTNEEE